MKFVTRARTLCVATLALLAASTAWADPFDGSPYYRNSRGSAISSPTSRVIGRPASLQTEPEAVTVPQGQSGGTDEGDVSWDDSAAGGDCDSCNLSGGCLSGGGLQRGMWYGSVDYLLFRPRFSQAVAEERRTLVTNTTVTPNTSTLTDTAVQFPFRYQSGFRAAVGYRLLNCGGDIQFAYWRLAANSQKVTDGPADTVTDNPFIAGQLKNNPGNGDFFAAQSGVTANIFDLDFAKCLSLGGPRGPCDVCFCPRWDLRWTAGVRGASISRFDNNQSLDPQGNPLTTGLINAHFSGAGPRVGVQGRRYFGGNGFLSVYAKASQALLIGQYHMTRSKTTPGDSEISTEITNQFDSFSRLVPVTDIEIGGSWQLAPYTFISAGWFFQCWWDLGQSETVIGTNFGPLDTANILAFDGLFVRGEILF